MKFPSTIQLSSDAAIVSPMEPRLPTFEQATGLVLGTPRLPSYSEGFKTRYHPYRRGVIGPDAIDKLLVRLFPFPFSFFSNSFLDIMDLTVDLCLVYHLRR